MFSYTLDELKQIANDALRFAKEKGASDAAVAVSDANGLHINIRKSEIDTIEKSQDKALSLTVYLGKKRGNASSADFKEASIRAAVEAAYNIASFTEEDPFSGLPEENLLEKNPKDLALYHPWPINSEEAIDLARRCEKAAFETDPKITNSEGASVSSHHAQFIMANSKGFLGGYPTSRHSISVAPIASVKESMERDFWYTTSRNPNELKSPEWVGQYAAKRALSRLNAKRLKTQKCPVLFEAPIALGLVNALASALAGGALYRKVSFLLDSLGTQIFPEHIQLFENPHLLGGIASAPFDDEGVQTKERHVILDGVVNGYFLSTYSARHLGLQTTGNSGGPHNLFFRSKKTKPNDNFEAMLKKMDKGLVVTELMGQGINPTTGDYSRGATGFWVENGQIQYPVHEITIASNLKDMYKQIVAIGSDTINRGGWESGSVLIENMTVAGH